MVLTTLSSQAAHCSSECCCCRVDLKSCSNRSTRPSSHSHTHDACSCVCGGGGGGGAIRSCHDSPQPNICIPAFLCVPPTSVRQASGCQAGEQEILSLAEDTNSGKLRAICLFAVSTGAATSIRVPRGAKISSGMLAQHTRVASQHSG